MNSRLRSLVLVSLAAFAAVSLQAASGAERLCGCDGPAIPTGRNPTWSPNGARIAFTRSDLDTQIYVMKRNGTGLRRLTTDPQGASYQPDWSPDGTRIAFVDERGDNADSYVMNADGTHVTRLTTDPAADLSPDWSPDGHSIVFASYRNSPEDDDLAQIYVMNADGSGQHRVVIDADDDIRPEWSPDGAKIAFEGGGDDSYIDVV